MDFTSLRDLELWCSHSSKAQDRLIEGLQGILKNDFTHQLTTEFAAGSGLRVPTFVHLAAGLEFNLIIGGVFNMGLSQGEEGNARRTDDTARIEFAQMRPVHQIRVSPFLMTKFPVLDLFVRNHISIDPELFRPDVAHAACLRPSRDAPGVVKLKASVAAQAGCMRCEKTEAAKTVSKHFILATHSLMKRLWNQQSCLATSTTLGAI